jgi:hypothetical protein
MSTAFVGIKKFSERMILFRETRVFSQAKFLPYG